MNISPDLEIPTKTIKSCLVTALREGIIAGKFKPGERLNESRLARQYKVSRVPVREALLQLQEQGLVMNSPRRGMFVNVLSEEDCAKINSLRIVLEAEALKLSRAKLTGAQEKHLLALIRKMEEWEPSTEIEAASLDLEFHRFIWTCSGNAYLEKILNSVVPILFAHQAIIDNHAEANHWPLDHHRRLLEVVQGTSSHSPEEAMVLHLSLRYTNPERYSSMAFRDYKAGIR